MKESVAYVGGGTLPEQDLDSFVVSVCLPELTAEALRSALRHSETPIIGRIEREHVLLDMRTVHDRELPLIIEAFEKISSG